MKHLKADTGMADSEALITKDSAKKQCSSLPPKMRKPNHQKHITIGGERD